MATHSTIGRYNNDGSVTSIYCHWDGYPAGVGAVLTKHYTDDAKIDALLALGDISSLGNEIGERHDFDSREHDEWTTAYGRDRGETDVAKMIHSSLGEWFRSRSGSGCEYAYLWDGGAWRVSKVTHRAYANGDLEILGPGKPVGSSPLGTL